MLRCKPILLIGAFAALILMPLSASAVTSFDFVSSGGQFSIAANSLSFGNGLTISAASVDGVTDTDLVGSTILLDPIILTGAVSSLPGGLAQIEIDTGIDYMLRIFQASGDGGALLMTAIYEPAEFITVGASGIISGAIEDGLGNIVLTALGMESAVLNALLTTTDLIDFNATLSAAGQDIAARIGSGALVTGAVAGSVATVIPEPSVALLMGLGLVGLRLSAGRAEQRSESLSNGPTPQAYRVGAASSP
jgi:hypothetical protein